MTGKICLIDLPDVILSNIFSFGDQYAFHRYARSHRKLSKVSKYPGSSPLIVCVDDGEFLQNLRPKTTILQWWVLISMVRRRSMDADPAYLPFMHSCESLGVIAENCDQPVAWEVVKDFKSLKTLSIQQDGMDETGTDVKLLQLWTLSSLQHLYVDGFPLNDRNVDSLPTSLVSLHMRPFNACKEDFSISETFPYLRHLSLRNITLTNHSLYTLAKHMPCLENLHILQLDRIREPRSDFICHAITRLSVGGHHERNHRTGELHSEIFSVDPSDIECVFPNLRSLSLFGIMLSKDEGDNVTMPLKGLDALDYTPLAACKNIINEWLLNQTGLRKLGIYKQAKTTLTKLSTILNAHHQTFLNDYITELTLSSGYVIDFFLRNLKTLRMAEHFDAKKDTYDTMIQKAVQFCPSLVALHISGCYFEPLASLTHVPSTLTNLYVTIYYTLWNPIEVTNTLFHGIKTLTNLKILGINQALYPDQAPAYANRTRIRFFDVLYKNLQKKLKTSHPDISIIRKFSNHEDHTVDCDLHSNFPSFFMPCTHHVF
jgi:hypothetical protein